MVTLAGTQNFSEFELHARAVLGLPIAEITCERIGASAVLLAKKEGINPTYIGLDKISIEKNSDFRIFGKPSTRPYRRMGVILTYDKLDSNIDVVKNRAIELANKIEVISQ
jgi:phosphoribosylglycinamide formyltransferase 2